MATINGNSGNNNLLGTSARDTLNGLGGNDTLNGGAGIDTLVGGTGDDIYIVDTTTDIIREDSGGGAHDTVRASVSYTLGDYLNDLTLTGTSAVNGTGNSYDNIITGNSANNILDGRGGNDTLIGGRGNDTYIVDSTTNEIVEYSGGGTDTVQSSMSYGLPAYVNNLVLTGTSGINGIGNNLDNVITGNNADNILLGESGNDFLNADNTYDEDGEGKDILQGGAGNDTLEGDNSDTLYGESGDDNMYGGDLLGSGTRTFMYGGDGNDYLSGTTTIMHGENGNDTLSGDTSNVYGGDGNDVLYVDYGSAVGGDGNDIIQGSYASTTGGNGNDTITVNSGYNNIRFNAATEGIDTITGFSVEGDFGDTISVSASGFGGGLIAGDETTPYGPAITPEQFVLGTAAVDASDRFIYNSANGALFFDVDGTGSINQVHFATLVGAPGITNNNIGIMV